MKIVAIVGRPNVGKSSLFNRIVGFRKTIVDEKSGVTRDRVYADVETEKGKFVLVDTGGFEPYGAEKIKNLMLRQTKVAIEEADLIVALFDAKEGLLPHDEELVKLLRKSNKKTLFVVNKIDNLKAEKNLLDFYSLGIEGFCKVSAAHGTGVLELVSEIVKRLPELDDQEQTGTARIGIAVVGRPNVGKSSIVNRLLRYERVMVHEEPGTTRDAVDTVFDYEGKTYTLIDTAGMRRRAKIDDRLEMTSVISALKAVSRASLVVLVVDADREIASQDLRIAGYATRKGKGLIVVVNKIDLVTDHTDIDYESFEKKLKKLYPSLNISPFVFASVALDMNIDLIMGEIERIYGFYNLRVETKDLNSFLREQEVNEHIGYVKGKRGVRGKVKYITQVGVAPPKFLVFCNSPGFIRDNYSRFLENKLRQKFGFHGVPINLRFRRE